MFETWIDITVENFEGCYQVSSIGRVKRVGVRRGARVGKILKPREQKGYIDVCLSKNNISRWFRVSRLVALAFVPNTDNKPQVNHINGIKTDNRHGNLEWVTASENTIHAYETGLLVISETTKRKMSHSAKKRWDVRRKLNE